MLESAQPNQSQSAYRIVAASEAVLLEEGGAGADVWDSGKISSDRSVHVSYEGVPLQAGSVYYWKVQVWDAAGVPSAWSEMSFWSMGLLDANDWKGQWIGRQTDPAIELPSAVYVRKSFSVRGIVRRAFVYGTALGVYELHLNGGRIGGDYFAPGWTDYACRAQYQTYDVTSLLRSGGNAIGAVIGTGWYAGHVGMMGRAIYGDSPAVLLQLHMEYADGEREAIVTDGSWRMNTGPIIYSDMLMGEKYDARLERTDWCEPGFSAEDDGAGGGWQPVDRFKPYAGKLVAQLDPPVRITESIRPLTVRRTERGTHIADMGQNMVGWVALKANGAAGATIKLRHGEMLSENGSLYTDNLRRAAQEEIYILRGGGPVWLEPHFTFHGFRYVEIEGIDGELTPDDVTGRVVHSDTPEAGRLITSDPMINRLISNIRWGQRGNYISVPTDCPQRDERLGWTGDAQIFIRTAAYNMDVSGFFSKFMNDIVDFQSPAGAFPDVAPDAGWFKFKQVSSVKWFAPDNAGWGDAGVIIPWTLYLMYGDERILRQHYDPMKRWIGYLQANSSELLRPDYANYGDWLSINADTPKDVLATAYFAYSALLLSRIAEVIGEEEDARHYARLYDRISDAFVRAYMDERGIMKGDTQTVYVLALYFGLLKDGRMRELAARRLEALIRGNGNRLSTGFLGVGYLLPALTQNGMSDIAYMLLHQDEFPSWLYSVKHGATTIWERWDGWTETGGFQSASMNSFNHYSLGSVGEWMYRFMAGLEADPAAPGFKHTFIRPYPGGKLTAVEASLDTAYGRLCSSWRLENGTLVLEVVVPANASATVCLPANAEMLVCPDGAVDLGTIRGERHFRIGSGSYRFAGRGI